jgi:parvulin-like peptidyl-prolyl isomerase
MNIQGFLVFLAVFFNFSLNSAHAETTLPKSSSGILIDRVEAIVNKSAIYRSDIKKFRSLTSLRMKVDPLFANDLLSKKTPTDAEIVDFLISEALILEKFPVTDPELEQEINAIQSNLHINREGLRSAISREGFQFEDYMQLMRASIAKRQLIDRDIRNKAAVSDDELKTEYNRTRSGSKSFQGSIHLHLIKITKKNYKTTKFAKDMFDQALKDLSLGETFEEVAKKTSDDSSANNGGDLGFLSYQDMAPALQKEVQKILASKSTDKNQLGKFEDSTGFTILKISEIGKDVDSGFDKEKEMLRGKLLEGEFQHQIKLWIDRQKSLNYIKINKKSA